MHAWYLPPLPNASPLPANVTVTDSAPGELTGTILAAARLALQYLAGSPPA